LTLNDSGTATVYISDSYTQGSAVVNSSNNGIFLHGKFKNEEVIKPMSAVVEVINAYIQVIHTKPEDYVLEWKRKVKNSMGPSIKHLYPLLPNLKEIMDVKEIYKETDIIENDNIIICLVANLLNSFSNPSLPVVIYLDDLHWADENTFYLLSFMLNISDFQFMSIIGSYRLDEIENSEAFQKFEQQLETGSFPVRKVKLTNFSFEQTNELVCDSLHQSLDTVVPLSEIIFEKTGGNPFFVRRFLQTIHDDHLLWMEPDNLAWKWDLESIKAKSYTTNIVKLLVNKINTLDENCTKFLQIASCYGFAFPSSIFAHFFPFMSEIELQDVLDELVRQQMIAPIPSIQKTSHDNFNTYRDQQPDYQFTHDKLLEAANQSLSFENRKAYHKKIGQNILKNVKGQELEGIHDVFTLANHFNSGFSIDSNGDAQTMYDLNLTAGRNAKKSGSFTVALDYFLRAEDIAKDLPLQSSELRALQLDIASCLQYTQNTDRAEKIYHQIFEEIDDKYEKSIVGEKMINFYANTGRHREAYNLGVRLLRLYRVKIPYSASKPRLILNVIKTKLMTHKLSYTEILHLKQGTDKDHVNIIKLLAALLKSAYQIAPELCIENAIRMVRLSLKNGNTVDSPVGYFSYGGIFLGGVFGNHQSGFDFGNLALELVDRYKSEKQQSEIEFIHGYFCNSWVKGPANSENYYEKAYRSGSVIGDFFHMSCSRAALAENNLLLGNPLLKVLNLSLDFQQFVRESQNHEAMVVLQSVAQASQILHRESFSGLDLSLESFEEATFNDKKDSFSSKHFIHMHYVNKMMLCFHAENKELGMEYADISHGLLGESPGLQHTVFHHFYYVLLAFSDSETATTKVQKVRAKKSLAYLKKAADFNRDVYGAVFLIANSFMYASKNKSALAVESISKAISDLKTRMEVNLLGIAYEHLAKMYLADQNVLQFHETIAFAFDAYRTWGAEAIVSKLNQFLHSTTEFEIPDRRGNQTYMSSTITSHDMDITSVMKFSRAITEEINLGALVNKVVKIMVENTASTRAYLIIKRGDIPYLYASFEGEKIESMQKINMRDFKQTSRYPIGIINYTLRTKSVLLLKNAVKSDFFSTDNYVVLNNTRSVLCQPLLMQQNIIGVLYLESDLSDNQYDARKEQLLQLLSTQIAISIENSLNFEEMEQTVLERTQELNLQKEIIEVKNKEIGDSIQYARTIQEAILPSTQAFAKHFNGHFLLSKPKDVVSGDFFWIEELDDTLLFAVADCTGHGVPAAMLSLVCNNALNRAVRELDKYEPAEILDAASANISATFTGTTNQIKKIQDGMDIALCSYDKKTKRLKYAGANNPVIILRPKGSADGVNEVMCDVIEQKGDKQPVGPYFKSVPFHQFNLQLMSGDVIILSTDGYHDQFGGKNAKKMKQKGFKELLVNMQKFPFNEQLPILEKHFEDWKGNELQIDDVTILGAKV